MTKDRPWVLLYIGGKCDGPVTDIHFTTLDKPPKTFARGSSLSDKQGKAGELSIEIDGALPTNIDTWSKKGKAAEGSEDIVIKHKDRRRKVHRTRTTSHEGGAEGTVRHHGQRHHRRAEDDTALQLHEPH